MKTKDKIIEESSPYKGVLEDLVFDYKAVSDCMQTYADQECKALNDTVERERDKTRQARLDGVQWVSEIASLKAELAEAVSIIRNNVKIYSNRDENGNPTAKFSEILLHSSQVSYFLTKHSK